MTQIGAGAYQAATPDAVLRTAAQVVLCHNNHAVALAVRAARPGALILLRADPGRDEQQVNTALPPEQEAARWGRLIAGRLGEVPRGTYSAASGINEAWPGRDDAPGLQWRAAFELTLCRIVQQQLGVGYAWGAIPVGSLEPEHVKLFASVWKEAAWCNYHGYLKPGRIDVATETEPWWLWRPFGLWLPELRRLGLPLRLILGECGTYTAPGMLGLGAGDLARIDVAIAAAVGGRARAEGVVFGGALAYGVGMMGDQDVWELSSVVDVIAAAGPEAAPGAAIPGGETVTLQQQYPSIFTDWQAAGGIENNFRKHLIAIGVLQPTAEDLKMLAGEAVASNQQLKNALDKFPFA